MIATLGPATATLYARDNIGRWPDEAYNGGMNESMPDLDDIEEGEATVLTRQLTAKFGQLDETHRSRIEQASAGELLVWAERIRTADRIEEVFGVRFPAITDLHRTRRSARPPTSIDTMSRQLEEGRCL